MRTLCSCDLMCVWCPLSNLKEELTYTNAWFRLIAWFGSVKKTPLPLVYTFSPFASTCWVEQFCFIPLIEELIWLCCRNSYFDFLEQCQIHADTERLLNNAVPSQSQSVLNACCETARAGHFRWGRSSQNRQGQRRSSDVLLGPCSEYGIQANYLIVSIDSYARYPHSSSLAVTLFCLICVCIILNCNCKVGFCLDIFLSYILNIVQDELSYHGLLP